MRRQSLISLSWLIATSIVLIASRGTAQGATAISDQPTDLKDALIVAIDGDAANLSVRNCLDPRKSCDDSRLINIRVDAPALRASLKSVQAGDQVRLKVTYAKPQSPTAEAPPQQANVSLPDAGSGTSVAVLMDFLGPYTSKPLALWIRIVILLVAALALLGIAAAATGGNPLVFVVGMDNRYSNSKVQVAFWFWIVISTYIAAWCFRMYEAGWSYCGMINIPQNLLLLSGLSAITYGGAKAITTSKANDADATAVANSVDQTTALANAQADLSDANAAASKLSSAQTALVSNPTDPGLIQAVTDAKTASDAKPIAQAQANVDALSTGVTVGVKTQATNADRKFFLNLLQNDIGGFDFGDFQMLVVTVIAAATYLILFVGYFENVAFTKAITLPDVDTTVLSIFGLGQGAYLAKKAGGNVGTS